MEELWDERHPEVAFKRRAQNQRRCGPLDSRKLVQAEVTSRATHLLRDLGGMA